MSAEQLNSISLRSLFNAINGYREKERMEWERTRIQTFLLLSPYMDAKNPLSVQAVWPMPWDDEVVEMVKDRAKEARDKAAEGWAKIDAWRNEGK
jgi:hypothetical protein